MESSCPVSKVYARSDNRLTVYELYRRSKTFAKHPSDVVYLSPRTSDLARYIFDRGVFLFGEHVERRLDEVTENASDRGMAQHARQSEFQRLMGGDMEDSTSGFADPAASEYASAGRDESGCAVTLASGY